MKVSLEQLKNKLVEKGINLSYQRLRILEYLLDYNVHPTVDQIYIDLHKEIETLSKTTVYNTLKILVDCGLVKALTIENNEVRYDIITENHGHFKCDECGSIFNFNIDVSSLDLIDVGDLNQFKVNERNVYFKGLCPSCLSNIENKIKEE